MLYVVIRKDISIVLWFDDILTQWERSDTEDSQKGST